MTSSQDPLLIARMLVVGRQCLDDAQQKVCVSELMPGPTNSSQFDTAQRKIVDKVEDSRVR